MTKNTLGLVVGLFFAIVHAVWSVAVALVPGPLQTFINWVLALHHVSLVMVIMPFVLSNAITLVILTFVVGYIFGWLIAFLSERLA